MIADLLTPKFSDVGLGLNIQIEALAQSLRNLQMAIIYGCEWIGGKNTFQSDQMAQATTVVQ